jgi:CRISPR/Cas system-associated exonuclease Cas4 (RecB family)
VWQPFPVTYQDETYEDRALVVWSAGKQRLDEEKRKTYLKRLLNRPAEIQEHLNQGRYIRREYGKPSVMEGRWFYDRRL